MVLSMGDPSLADRRYFLSQMSSEASWKGMLETSCGSSLTTVFIFLSSLPKKLPEERRPARAMRPSLDSRLLIFVSSDVYLRIARGVLRQATLARGAHTD